LKHKLGYDDALDAFGCHGIGGTWGGIATGIFASKSINAAGADGLIHGSAKLLGAQLIAIVATYAYAAIATFIILKIVSLVFKLRVTEEEEQTGLDIAVHGEHAYGQESL
jgi:Amt family ammonium transporter